MLQHPYFIRLASYYSAALILILTFSLPTLAQDPLHVEKQAQLDAVIAMLQSTDTNAVERYVDANMHPDALTRWNGEGRTRYIGWLNAEKRFHQSLTFQSAPTFKANDQRLQANFLSTSTTLPYTLHISLSKDTPIKVVSLYLDTAQVDVDADSPGLTKSEIAAKLKEYVDTLANNGVFSGSVLLADDSGVLYQSAKGYAEQRFKVPNNVDTKFNIASMGKMFTAVSVLQLVEAGRLSLKDPLTKFVDRARFGEGEFDAITIEQLLSHTAGLGYPNSPKTHPNDMRNLHDQQQHLQYIPLVAKPGSQFRYSNEGMMLLGLVIETISKQSYDDYLQEHVFAKAGMVNTGNFDVDGVTPNLATNYFYSDSLKSLQANWLIHAIKGGPSGGGYSTVGDLHAFSTALTGYKLLSNSYTELAYSAKPELNSPRYGFGFAVRQDHNGKSVGHNGAFIGTSAEFRIFLDKGLTLTILGNQSSVSEPVFYVAERLISRLKM